MNLKNKRLFSLLALLLATAFLLTFASCAGQETPSSSSEPVSETASGEASQPVSDEPAESSESSAEEDPVRVYTLMGPTGMGMAQLISESKAGKTALKYDFTIASAPDQISAEVIKGNYDIAAVPVNLASVLYNKAGSLQVAAVNTLGVLYMLENGDTVHSVEDLRGKTVYATGQGSTPEFILRYILTKNGIDPEKDLTLEFVAEHAELATRMVSGDVVLGMLPEPNVTNVLLNNENVRIALNLTEEWKKVSDTDLVQGCIIVSSTFAEKRPDAVAKFLEEYGKSVAFVNSEIDSAAAMIEEAGIVPKAAIAKKAIPNCNIVLVTGEQMKAQMSAMLQVLYDASSKSVGGKLPDDSFYHTGS